MRRKMLFIMDSRHKYRNHYVSDVIIIIIIIIINKGRQCKAERESDVHPISPKTPAPQYQPIDQRFLTPPFPPWFFDIIASLVHISKWIKFQ